MDALTELAGSGNKVDIRIVRYILKQKGTIIKELQNEVKFLKLHTEVLNKQIGQLGEIELQPEKSFVSIVKGVKVDKQTNANKPIDITFENGPSSENVSDVANLEDKEWTTVEYSKGKRLLKDKNYASWNGAAGHKQKRIVVTGSKTVSEGNANKLKQDCRTGAPRALFRSCL
ncbi:hypothetical protein C0J52_13810 [Blattella germanica]|nr:hypothetical protein C0J52_13810 [Blattella germanica]